MRATRRLAVDLGTVNTVVHRRGDGIVLFEPSLAVVDKRTGEVESVGRRLMGRTPEHLKALHPLRHGVVTDLETAEAMLRHFIRRLSGFRERPLVTLCVPTGITQVEREAAAEATLAAGASEAWLIEESLAAAIGAGLPVSEAVGSSSTSAGVPPNLPSRPVAASSPRIRVGSAATISTPRSWDTSGSERTCSSASSRRRF
jgi:rod shape-determining protein MreB